MAVELQTETLEPTFLGVEGGSVTMGNDDVVPILELHAQAAELVRNGPTRTIGGDVQRTSEPIVIHRPKDQIVNTFVTSLNNLMLNYSLMDLDQSVTLVRDPLLTSGGAAGAYWRRLVPLSVMSNLCLLCTI